MWELSRKQSILQFKLQIWNLTNPVTLQTSSCKSQWWPVSVCPGSLCQEEIHSLEILSVLGNSMSLRHKKPVIFRIFKAAIAWSWMLSRCLRYTDFPVPMKLRFTGLHRMQLRNASLSRLVEDQQKWSLLVILNYQAKN